MRLSKWIVFIMFEFATAFIACLQVIPERAKVDYQNPKFLKDVEFSVVRYGRRSKYYINAVGTNMQTWENNVTVNCLFYEYLHNEYRRSFVEMHFKFCELVKSDPYVGKLLKNAGIECPVVPGTYALRNLTVPTENFNMVWPFEKSRVDVEIVSSTGESMARANIHLKFVNERKKKPKTTG